MKGDVLSWFSMNEVVILEAVLLNAVFGKFGFESLAALESIVGYSLISFFDDQLSCFESSKCGYSSFSICSFDFLWFSYLLELFFGKPFGKRLIFDSCLFFWLFFGIGVYFDWPAAQTIGNNGGDYDSCRYDWYNNSYDHFSLTVLRRFLAFILL